MTVQKETMQPAISFTVTTFSCCFKLKDFKIYCMYLYLLWVCFGWTVTFFKLSWTQTQRHCLFKQSRRNQTNFESLCIFFFSRRLSELLKVNASLSETWRSAAHFFFRGNYNNCKQEQREANVLLFHSGILMLVEHFTVHTLFKHFAAVLNELTVWKWFNTQNVHDKKRLHWI